MSLRGHENIIRTRVNTTNSGGTLGSGATRCRRGRKSTFRKAPDVPSAFTGERIGRTLVCRIRGLMNSDLSSPRGRSRTASFARDLWPSWPNRPDFSGERLYSQTIQEQIEASTIGTFNSVFGFVAELTSRQNIVFRFLCPDDVSAPDAPFGPCGRCSKTALPALSRAGSSLYSCMGARRAGAGRGCPSPAP